MALNICLVVSEIEQSEYHDKEDTELVEPVSKEVGQTSVIMYHVRRLQTEEDETQPESQDGGVFP